MTENQIYNFYDKYKTVSTAVLNECRIGVTPQTYELNFKKCKASRKKTNIYFS